MPKTLPVSISCEGHGLSGNLVLPDKASPEAPVPGVLIAGGPGPLPLQRYSKEGARQWPVLWSEAMAGAGLASLCYDQRGSGLSSGLYHEADWQALFEDTRAALDMLRVQPEVRGTAVVAWGEGCPFSLQLAASGEVNAAVLLGPAYHTEEVRYARGIAALAARKGLSDRVVQVRVSQWQAGILAATQRVQAGEQIATTDVGGQPVTTNLVRFLQTVAFDPASVVARVRVPVLLLHGEDDGVIPPAESKAMLDAMPVPADRITYRGAAHFLYRHPKAQTDAVAWLRRTLLPEAQA